jgi:hypothetical protein
MKPLILCVPILVAVLPAQVPDNLKPPASEKIALKARGEGLQIYTCAAGNNPETYSWTLKKPQADLFDDQGKKIGTHYAGPTWEALDGSKVVGQVEQKADSPAHSIPWLLLKAKSNEGQGLLSKVSFIQRVKTEGGVAPQTGCDREHAGAEKSVKYQADYLFYAPQP